MCRDEGIVAVKVTRPRADITSSFNDAFISTAASLFASARTQRASTSAGGAAGTVAMMTTGHIDLVFKIVSAECFFLWELPLQSANDTMKSGTVNEYFKPNMQAEKCQILTSFKKYSW